MKKHFFDNKRKVTAKLIEKDVAFDTVHEQGYPVTEEYKQEHMVEISQPSFQQLQPDLKKWFNVDNEFSTELTFPVLKRINEELKKYGI